MAERSIPVAVAVGDEEDDGVFPEDAAIGEEVEENFGKRSVLRTIKYVTDDLLYHALPNTLKGYEYGVERRSRSPLRFAKRPIIGQPGTINSVFQPYERVRPRNYKYEVPSRNIFYSRMMLFLPTDMYKLFLILPDNSNFSTQQLVVVIRRMPHMVKEKRNGKDIEFETHGIQYYSMGFVPLKYMDESIFSLSSPHVKFTTVKDMRSQTKYALHDFKPLEDRAKALNDIVSDYDFCVKNSPTKNTTVYAFNSHEVIHYGFEYNSLTGFKTVFKIPSKRLHTVRNSITMFATGKMKKKNKKNNKTQKKRIK